MSISSARKKVILAGGVFAFFTLLAAAKEVAGATVEARPALVLLFIAAATLGGLVAVVLRRRYVKRDSSDHKADQDTGKQTSIGWSRIWFFGVMALVPFTGLIPSVGVIVLAALTFGFVVSLVAVTAIWRDEVEQLIARMESSTNGTGQ